MLGKCAIFIILKFLQLLVIMKFLIELLAHPHVPIRIMLILIVDHLLLAIILHIFAHIAIALPFISVSSFILVLPGI